MGRQARADRTAKDDDCREPGEPRSARASDGGKFVQGARRQALEAFRGDSFDASALARVEHRGERVEKIAQAMVPVLTPAQRATLARGLRAHAARESRS